MTQPKESDKLKIIELKINTYNIRLTGKDVLMMSEDKEIKSVSDIQKCLTRIYLAEDFKFNRNFFLSHYYSDHFFNFKLLEYSAFDYFNLSHKLSYVVFPHIATLNAKVISHFVQDIFMDSHHESKIRDKEMAYIDGAFYSFDTLQYYLFESKPFKETILDILREAVIRGK